MMLLSMLLLIDRGIEDEDEDEDGEDSKEGKLRTITNSF